MAVARTHGFPRRIAAASALLLALAAPPAAAQGVAVALLPAQQSVAPGAGLDLEIDATRAGSPFNGFEIVVTFDPAALTFVPTSPTSLQQGSYMTGACGNTFHVFAAAADSMVIDDALLCAGTLLPGPGQLYRLHFTAAATAQVTWVRFRRADFYAGGPAVHPVETLDAAIGVGEPLGVGVPPAGPRAPRVSALPNPVQGSSAIRVETGVAGEQDVVVCDLLGRTVRRLDHGRYAAGLRTIPWDGRDGQGRRLAAGVYLVRLDAGGRVVSARVALLR